MDPFARALEDERESVLVPWRSLASLVQPLPGTLIIVLGAPGVAKSLISLAWALELAVAGFPAGVVSLDTDSKTQAARVTAHMLKIPYKEVLADPRRYALYLRELRLPLHVLDRQITPREIPELMEATECMFGESPHLLVVDDCSKLVAGARDFDGYDEAFARLHQAARRYSSVVMAIHKLRRGTGGASRRNNAGTRPVNLDDGQFTGEYEAEIVLGLWRVTGDNGQPVPDVVRMGILKNRNGMSDPNGGLFVDLVVDFDKAQVTDPADYLQGASMDEVMIDIGLTGEDEESVWP